MRLIDADGLVTKILEEHKKAEDTYDLCVDEVKDILCGIVSLIDEQPTAYDLDKVVAELERKKFIEQETILSDIHQGFNAGLSAAIQVVKGGGVDGN